MPGLLRGVARTAVIAGTASAVNGRVQRRQAEKFADRDAHIYAERDQAYANATGTSASGTSASGTSAGTSDRIDQLRQLGELRDKGVLTDQEFAAEKAKIMGAA